MALAAMIKRIRVIHVAETMPVQKNLKGRSRSCEARRDTSAPVGCIVVWGGCVCSNIGTKALLEEEKRISKRMEAIGIGFPSQHIDAHRHRLAALEAPIALVLKSYRETDLVGERLDVIRIMTISAVWAERVSATYEPPGPFYIEGVKTHRCCHNQTVSNRLRYLWAHRGERAGDTIKIRQRRVRSRLRPPPPAFQRTRVHERTRRKRRSSGAFGRDLPTTVAGRRTNSRFSGHIRRPSLSAGFRVHNFSSDLCDAPVDRSGEAQDPALLHP